LSPTLMSAVLPSRPPASLPLAASTVLAAATEVTDAGVDGDVVAAPCKAERDGMAGAADARRLALESDAEVPAVSGLSMTCTAVSLASRSACAVIDSAILVPFPNYPMSFLTEYVMRKFHHRRLDHREPLRIVSRPIILKQTPCFPAVYTSSKSVMGCL
jgi:hypothetical protein